MVDVLALRSKTERCWAWVRVVFAFAFNRDVVRAETTTGDPFPVPVSATFPLPTLEMLSGALTTPAGMLLGVVPLLLLLFRWW